MKTKDVGILKVLQITADMLGVDKHKLTLDTSFSDDLGADSLDVYELIVAIEKEFKINVSDEDAEKITTIGKLVDYTNNKLNKNRTQSTEQHNEATVKITFKEEIINKNLLPSPENN